VPEANILLAEEFFEDRTQTNPEEFVDSFDPEAEVDLSDLDEPYGRFYRGREQIEALFQEMTAGWWEIRFRATKPFASADNVVIDVERTAVLRPGGFGVSWLFTAALTFRSGKIVQFKLFRDRGDALAAAGISQ
jgi:ketosteroid isomerase-like protein